eukprot:12895110-Prorocentrum_lima.AAC.1
MEPGFYLNVHVDMLIYITVCYAWPMVVLVHCSAWANVICWASQALTTAFCGIGPSPISEQRNTSTFQ